MLKNIVLDDYNARIVDRVKRGAYYSNTHNLEDIVSNDEHRVKY